MDDEADVTTTFKAVIEDSNNYYTKQVCINTSTNWIDSIALEWRCVFQYNNRRMVYKIVRDPAHNLSHLRQASYILNCISEGRTRKEIVEEFDGDEQLVLIWINYLMERNYLSLGHN